MNCFAWPSRDAPPRDYFVRAIEAEYGHPAYEAQIDYLMNVIGTPHDFTNLKVTITPEQETRVFSEELIQAVLDDNKPQAMRVLESRKAVAYLKNPEDPRSRPILLSAQSTSS